VTRCAAERGRLSSGGRPVRDDVAMTGRARGTGGVARALVVAAVLAVPAVAVGCSSESQVSVASDAGEGTTAASRPSPSTSDPGSSAELPATSVPASTAPGTTVAATTQPGTGSKQDGDCVPPQQFRDIDADGWGVCFLPEGAVGAPDGETIVGVPGSFDVVQGGITATIGVSDCRGNGADGTVTITAELSYFGSSTIDRGSVNVQLIDVDGRRATVAALLVSPPPRTPVQLDFATDGADSPARAIGEVQACWLDRVQDVTFFTGL
jgi:hypothetical protein